MRILMFGWEFPPSISGGLGTACSGITRALTAMGHDVAFVMPRWEGEKRAGDVELIAASRVPLAASDLANPAFWKGLVVRAVHSALRPYLNDHHYRSFLTGRPDAPVVEMTGRYGDNLLSEVIRYGRVAGVIARNRRFDVIHGHDWMTVFAGLEAKKTTGKPFLLHIHALEFDRSGENINQDIYDIERYGMEEADHVIAVSHYTKRIIVKRYGIDPVKITVVHNAVDPPGQGEPQTLRKDRSRKTVLYLGRITFQKGPDYFIEAAARVLKVLSDVDFIMAGDGDMAHAMMKRVAELGIRERFLFPGFLTGGEVEAILDRSDVYVMPSVSEPFGITPLEAMRRNVPVILSSRAGVSEILHHVLKVDFWDVEALADKIIAVLRRPALTEEMTVRSREDIKRLSWETAAQKIIDLYRSLQVPDRQGDDVDLITGDR